MSLSPWGSFLEMEADTNEGNVLFSRGTELTEHSIILQGDLLGRLTGSEVGGLTVVICMLESWMTQ